MEHATMNAGEEEIDITRWECVLRIRAQDWRMQVVVAGGLAWCSFGRAGGRKHRFMMPAESPDPDLCNHFRRAVIRAVQQF